MGTTRQTVAIIGGGPAGLTAAHELKGCTDFHPTVYEAGDQVGGIAKTVAYKGNRIDFGGHRFFSKSDRIMDWWMRMLPVQTAPAANEPILEDPTGTMILSPPEGDSDPVTDPQQTDEVMLIRRRLSRILYLGRFFDYPVSLSWQTIRNLGLWRMMRIGASYLRARISSTKPEMSLEDFFVNRFGRELYGTFFRDYTEKVWGLPCGRIKPEWGAQRIKELSVAKAIAHALKSVFVRDRSLGQKDTQTSLIGRFLYPKLGPGQMWETVARRVTDSGGEIHLRRRIVTLECEGRRIGKVRVRNELTGEVQEQPADWVISTMPIRDLIAAMGDYAPEEIRRLAAGLAYRSFRTVGVLAKRLKLSNDTSTPTRNGGVPDNWIYIQEKNVKVGRLQLFHNWSPYMVADPDLSWIGAEYFCSEDPYDPLWNLPDDAMTRLAVEELASIGVVDPADVIDAVALRMPDAYPAYFGESYERFDEIRKFIDSIENLLPVGRNGMHRYNNQDHSMLSAMEAVACIASGQIDRERIWAVNAEQDHHEQRITGIEQFTDGGLLADDEQRQEGGEL